MSHTRRELLDLLVRAAALPAGAEFLATWLQAGQAHRHSAAPPQPPLLRNYQPKFFDSADFEALQSFTEILIPTDDTPGAREAYCAHFIDFLLNSADEVPALQKHWRQAMAALKQAGFHAADRNGRAALIEAMSKPERDPSAHHPAYFVYQLVKRENTFAFYTSRSGMIDTLDYKGNTYNAFFPACTHPEHHRI
ncbi:MAG TPA: gluconate 2-dehydrogenase subunit 3 family protein [Bryobacteraceae bacterium]|jgi:hypothetical protein|nr:gluconate 2-dehydrogenase subunit 3 family protein [Bryobacteraceae bacterium]